jgi:hypothetical protein
MYLPQEELEIEVTFPLPPNFTVGVLISKDAPPSKHDQKWAFDEFLFCKISALDEDREEASEAAEFGQVET